jgi:DNA (cytosine-5)-methyltransferase 1
MRSGHLFNGIGGFALAAEMMGWKNIFHCEIDPFCNAVMKKHFPDSIELMDIKKQNFNVYLHTIDLITGGFPCQPYSTAGKRLGKEDERHLWPEMLRAIREIQPGYVVGENVRGLTNWNGGMVFDEVQADLETEGYEVLPFLLPAAGVEAPHVRDRIWLIAYSDSNRRAQYPEFSKNDNGQPVEGVEKRYEPDALYGRRTFTDADSSERSERRLHPEQSETTMGYARLRTSRNYGQEGWREFPTQSPICRGNDGIPHRVDRIKSLGNAIVPQVALQIFKAIEQFEKTYHGIK